MLALERSSLDQGAFAAKYGPWAVIAGACEGTGACYAELLAEMGINPVLVSRDQDALHTLGERLKAMYGVDYRVLVIDLTQPGAGDAMVRNTADLKVGLYISNAGTDGAGYAFLDEPKNRAHRLVAMSVSTLIDAAHGFGNRMRVSGGGGIIIMSSVAAFAGQARLAMYTSTKSFGITLAESLWAELRDYNIDVSAIAAPGMHTPAMRRVAEGTVFDLETVFDPTDVAFNALAALQSRDPLMVVPDGPRPETMPDIRVDRRARTIEALKYSKRFQS